MNAEQMKKRYYKMSFVEQQLFLQHIGSADANDIIDLPKRKCTCKYPMFTTHKGKCANCGGKLK